jgi:hypothetical protein
VNVREISIEAPRAACTTVSVSTSSAQSSALEGRDIVYVCDQVSYILFGANPTATTSCLRVPADTMLRINNIKANDKLAIIAAGSGTAFIAPAI